MKKTTRISNPQELGAAIRDKRKSDKIRIDEAAAYIGISVSTLSALENGSRPVGADIIFKAFYWLGLRCHVVRIGQKLSDIDTRIETVYE